MKKNQKTKKTIMLIILTAILAGCSNNLSFVDGKTNYKTEICKMQEAGIISTYKISSLDYETIVDEIEVKLVFHPDYFIGDKKELNEDDRKEIEKTFSDEMGLDESELTVDFVNEGVRVVFIAKDNVLDELILDDTNDSKIMNDIIKQLVIKGYTCEADSK
ncbi:MULTISPECIES: hypothetical protein [unclassified Breznakia]|uniref:hypothetical protein n=1 Tax=unclassified Breznakia TaxID=2623764 RepID=UPI002472E8C4|nr:MULTISPECIES: hypothetical protein [unclassified Breznakia]MDH6365997.1 hypothetical protein [Breznakia sp. PH1-1]MDH6403071.1 hypothetical protein [Breznakia sp. PF1-11]MDH6410780.1 hypothetical protein [Breznakia sp. PFB1-11]MDH6413163.1 hypothetical protein [Breznakia sp. PFB1-14]MDH6415531.1 hypothetical protein [Breznakia sp. PFB1-4]